MKNNFRKKIWIDRFQTGLVVRIVSYCLTFQLIGWVFFALCDQVDVYIASLGGEGHFLSNAFVRSLWALVLLMPPLIFEVVRFSHRLVGPLYRFRKSIQALANGEPVSLVQLRGGDLLMDMKDDFNAMLLQLEKRGLVVVKTAANSLPIEAPQAIESPALAVE